MIWLMLSLMLVVVPALAATMLQASAWPFDSYPMFSQRLQAETLTFFRIAYEDKNGRLRWWKPRYYKLVETFGQEAKACFKAPQQVHCRRLDALFARIGHCLLNDSAARDAISICLVKRRFRHDERIGWHFVDVLADRRAIARLESVYEL